MHEDDELPPVLGVLCEPSALSGESREAPAAIELSNSYVRDYPHVPYLALRPFARPAINPITCY
jgi:hypothetical protein